MHCYYCGGDLFASSLNRRDCYKLAFNDRFSNILSLPSVNARITGAGMLGAHRYSRPARNQLDSKSTTKYGEIALGRIGTDARPEEGQLVGVLSDQDREFE
jgi:hypothetical protein